jgi:hypothetical protein
MCQCVNKNLRQRWWKVQGGQWVGMLCGILLKSSVLGTFVRIGGEYSTFVFEAWANSITMGNYWGNENNNGWNLLSNVYSSTRFGY